MLHLNAGNSSSYSGSGNTWSDLSSSGNNGTINGATFNSTNKSFDFDGTNDYIGLSAVLPQGQAVYTIEGYFKQDTQQTGVIFEQSGNNGTNKGRKKMKAKSENTQLKKNKAKKMIGGCQEKRGEKKQKERRNVR